MYAKLKDGKLIKFEGRKLSYTLTIDEKLYYVSAINPTEEEFVQAGYYKVIATPEELNNEDTTYTMAGNTIVPVGKVKDENADKETDIQ